MSLCRPVPSRLAGILLLVAGILLAPAAGGRDDQADRRARWEAMTPAQRQQILQRWERYNSLGPEQKERLRKRYEWWSRLTRQERNFILSYLDAYDALGPEEKRGFDLFVARFTALPPAERQEARRLILRLSRVPHQRQIGAFNSHPWSRDVTPLERRGLRALWRELGKQRVESSGR